MRNQIKEIGQQSDKNQVIELLQQMNSKFSNMEHEMK